MSVTAVRRFHAWATVGWLAVSVPAAIVWGNSVVFVVWLSLYAIVVSHWAAYQAVRVEERQDNGDD